MSDPIYKIKDWQRHFENNRSRTVENLRWVCVPNKHDGEGFATVMEQENAAELFAAWVLILQVASKCQERGSLVREDGTPLTARAMAVKTRAPESWFKEAFKFFITKVKWMDCQASVTQLSGNCQAGDTQVTKKEGNRREGNGSEVKRASKARPQTREEFDAFFQELGLYPRNAEATWNKFEGNDWTNGGKKIACWKSTVRAWKASGYMPSQKSPSDYEPEWPRAQSAAETDPEEDDLMAKLLRLKEAEAREAAGDHPDYWTEEEIEKEEAGCF
jgi:hypothetical protein